MQAAAEGEMLTEVQWRVAALEALHAFVVGPCTRCGPLQAATLTATCASLLQPTLDAVCAAPALQVFFPVLLHTHLGHMHYRTSITYMKVSQLPPCSMCQY